MREKMDLFVGQSQGTRRREDEIIRAHAEAGFSPSKFIQICLETLPEII